MSPRLIPGLLLASLLTTLAACGGSGLGPPLGSCSDLKDAASCSANGSCEPAGCTLCAGGSSFSGCYDKGKAPLIACPAIACAPPCNTLTDRARCEANPLCEAPGCPDCAGGQTFTACYDKGKGPVIDCAPSCPDCASLTSESTCAATSGCHAVFVDPHSCACAGAGCCTQFDHCAAGPAECSPTPSGPSCGLPTPLCEGAFVVGYSGSCPEGCVRQTACNDCRSTGCASGSSCQLCFASYSCLPDGAVC